MFHITLIDVVCIAINLIVLFLLLKKFLFKPVTAMMDSRQEEIQRNLSHAETARTEAELLREGYDKQLQSAQAEAADIVAQSKARGDEEYQKILATAREDAEAVAQRTHAQLESERVEMLLGVKKEVSSLALLAAARVSGRAFDAQEDEAFVSSFLAEVGEADE